MHDLQDEFGHRYQDARGVRAFHAPGRVNLIGEHTDYNGGLVLPCAIDRGTQLLVRRTAARSIKLASLNFDLIAILSPDEAGTAVGDHWINYPLGVIAQFAKRGVTVTGIECLYRGDIPNGAGLSSSASVNIVTAVALNAVFECGFSQLELVHMAQAAENEFIGLACGVMDPYAIAMGQRGHAMALDCSTLECDQVPLDLDGHTLVISNSNQRRELNDSGYNTRHRECVTALEIVQQSHGIEALAALDMATLASQASAFAGQDTAFRRARHVVTEQARVLGACEALRAGDLAQFGQHMCASHASLAQDFDVSTPALDALVAAAMAVPGVVGSRMTGAGFGGCTVSLVADTALAAFESEVSARYHRETGLTADFHPVVASDGAGERPL
ncbi:MAG: galactokinase [Pseudomonadota bacterium]